MKNLRAQLLAMFLPLLIWPLVQPPGPAEAVTLVDEQTISTAEAAGPAAPAAGPVLFLAWDGNRLLTTAGVFMVDDSVQVIDKAGSRLLPAGFSGRLPKVEMGYEGRKLNTITIE